MLIVRHKNVFRLAFLSQPQRTMSNQKKILLMEPFYGGSHRQLIDLLLEFLPSDDVHLETMSAKKWHWRSRTSALHFAQTVPKDHDFSVVFCSSVLNLAELLALRPDLAKAKKVLYFHENQLVYPVRKRKDRDFQYGYNQVVSSLVADKVVFNSRYNQESFLSSIASFMKLQPDYRPKNLREQIEPKCSVLYFPISLPPNLPDVQNNTPKEAAYADGMLHIVWPHRWEHDKNPEAFFSCLLQLQSDGFLFKVSVLGQAFSESPAVFESARAQLHHVHHWGYAPQKADYWRVLREADVAVSTAVHEFFGVSMMEAAFCGCYPLVPDRLAYPEVFPGECVYGTDRQLYKKLRGFCKSPERLRKLKLDLGVEKFSKECLKDEYVRLFRPKIRCDYGRTCENNLKKCHRQQLVYNLTQPILRDSSKMRKLQDRRFTWGFAQKLLKICGILEKAASPFNMCT